MIWEVFISMILNDEQKNAVYTEEPYVFLLAGAGSGKTRVIVERIKYLISKGVRKEDILCITFTKKAALEMEERLIDTSVSVYTFHGYCYELLAKNKSIKLFEYNNEFLENDILKIANYKNSLGKIKKPSTYDRYQTYLKSRGLVDFDDLLIEALDEVKYHTYQYIFVDEFQDTNLLQFKLLETMLHPNVSFFAVGDPDQSIYGFRGARYELITYFLEKYQAKLLKLERNYRSTNAILDVSNRLIKNNINRIKKTLKGDKTMDVKPIIWIGSVESIEVKIVQTIKKHKYFDAVILYRNHYQAVRLKQILKRNYLFNVRLMSFHESKGLEFETVFIIGVESLPFDKDLMYKNEEEERRLLFVGLTRAKTNLFIVTTRKTQWIKDLRLDVLYI